MSSEIISILSLVFGMAGIIFALLQYQSRIRVEATLKTQLSAALNRITKMVPLRGDLEKMLQGVNQGNLVRWIWIRYKGLCDLYVMMVTHFLFFEKRFTYDDLKRLVDNKVISSSWEEDIWRNLIAQRPENRNATVPDPFISR